MASEYWQECISCGVRWGVSATYDAKRREDKETFYCPNGHPQLYSVSEADKLRRERDRLAQRIAQKDDQIKWERERAEQAERRASAMKGVATRMKKRVANGVCPCCNRTFANLQRHMASKHPGLADAEVTPEGVTVQ